MSAVSHSPVSWQSPQVPSADPAPPAGPAAGQDELMGATTLTLFQKDFQDQSPSQVNISIADVALSWCFLFIYSWEEGVLNYLVAARVDSSILSLLYHTSLKV